MNSNINLLIDRINELSRKQRSTGLEDSERVEQAELRQKYLAFIREQVKGSLGNIEIVDNSEPGHDHGPCKH